MPLFSLNVDETVRSRIARNFFMHSGHVPLTILILEVLLASSGYFSKPDPYVLLCAGVVQAWAMETLGAHGRPSPFLGNLVGPLVYSLVEAPLEGAKFFHLWHHQAYWLFALGFGLLHWQQARRATPVMGLVLTENILRAAIPLVMYAIFEVQASDGHKLLRSFLDDSAHVFLTIVLLLLGALLGFADLNLRRSMATIRSLAARLREYSAWSLGHGILDRAIADESALSLQRAERAVLFMDIRGFTAWSENQTPEAVVSMLNRYYGIAETALAGECAIKLKYTADEVMAVFADAESAVQAGRNMLEATRPLLAEIGLAAGAGVHFGSVMEGVLGGVGAKAYDFIGDTVNTAQRLCDAALPGELLVSTLACQAAGVDAVKQRHISVKGKRAPLAVEVIA